MSDHGRPHPDEALLPPDEPQYINPRLTVSQEEFERLLDEAPTPAAQIELLRAQIASRTADDPSWRKARGAFQFMTGSWAGYAPERFQERSGDRSAERSVVGEAIALSQSHWTRAVPTLVAHSEPVIGCAYCLGDDRSIGAVSMLRAIAPGQALQPHIALYVLAADDLARERS